MTTKADREEDRRGRLVEGCTEATAEAWAGGCRVLGDLFRGLSDSFYRTSRRRSEAATEGGRARSRFGCVDEYQSTVESVASSVANAAAEAGRTITKAADICADSVSSRGEETRAAADASPPSRAEAPGKTK